MALALPENNPWYHGSGDGAPAGYRWRGICGRIWAVRGLGECIAAHIWLQDRCERRACLERAISHCLDQQICVRIALGQSVDGIPQTTLPTDEDTTRYIIEDPYSWINDYLGHTQRQDRQRHGWGTPRGNDIGLKMVSGSSFDDIYDCRTDELHIPRVLTWSVEPRSREYMNMALPPGELFELYFATLERRVEDERYGNDYSEEVMQQLRARPRGAERGDELDRGW